MVISSEIKQCDGYGIAHIKITVTGSYVSMLRKRDVDKMLAARAMGAFKFLRKPAQQQFPEPWQLPCRLGQFCLVYKGIVTLRGPSEKGLCIKYVISGNDVFPRW